MKQQITDHQWQELNNSQKIIEWYKSKGYNPNLTIGQMIEYISEQHESWQEGLYIDQGDGLWYVGSISMEAERIPKKMSGYELCDVLWEKVKYFAER